MPASNVLLKEQLNMYINYQRDVKNSSANTLQAYQRDLEKFFSFAELHNIKSFSDLSVKEVEVYKSHLASCGLSPSSVSRSLSALRSLIQYLISIGQASINPAKSVHNDKPEKKGFNILSSSEIDLLLNQPDVKEVKGIRDKAMLETLYATGIKVSELINLNVSDVNITLSFISCGSGENERLIPIYPICLRSIVNYLEKSRLQLVSDPSEQALFVNTNGTRMTRQGFWKILKGYAASANIKKEITPHTLRHSFAAHLLENGADIHDIQEILGHRELASTQKYAQFLKDKMRNSYMKFHPRA